MANLPTFTEDNLAALNEAIATGAKVVEYSDKRVEYRSLDDMLRIKNAMLLSLGAKPAPTRFVPKVGKGL